MARSKEEVLEYVKEHDIKFIRLAFCDVFGNEKNIAIMPEELPNAFENGIPFDASQVPDFGEGINHDLYLHPEPDTLSMLPWKEQGDGAVRMYCSMTNPDGSLFDRRGTKSLLKEAIKEAEELGYEFYFGSELEFYLFETDENGRPTTVPYDTATYLDISPEDKSEHIRRDICVYLEKMGVHPKSTHHEFGPGQNEISIGFLDPISAGNSITTLKTVVKNVASENGLYAELSPKPLDTENGNGLHFTFSVRSADGTDSAMKNAIAGVLDKIEDMTVFFNRRINSYDRLGKYGAPKYITWTSENRNQLVRVPVTKSKYSNAKLRSTDPACNPFLVFALIIKAALYGIKNELELPEPTNFDLGDAFVSTLEQYKQLPSNLQDARMIAMRSDFIKENVPQDIIDLYCGL